MAAGREYPLISVALCTYNGDRFVAEQIQSILDQTWPNLELVIFDDASTDSTSSIIQAFAAADKRIRSHIYPKQVGLNQNFLRAFEACRGAFIAPSDQDDIWHSEKLEKLYTALRGADIAYCDSQYVDLIGRPMGFQMSSMRRMYQGRDPLRFVFTNCVSGHALLARAHLTKTLRQHSAVPYDWGLAIAAAGGKGLVYVDEPLVHFRRHQHTSTTLGHPQPKSVPSTNEYWNERKSIIDFIQAYGGHRRAAAKKLSSTLIHWRAGGSKLPFLACCARYMIPLFWIMSRKPALFIRGALRQIKLSSREEG